MEKYNLKAVVPLDMALGIDRLPFKITVQMMLEEALQKPSLILRPESFYLLHRSNFCANDCSGYF